MMYLTGTAKVIGWGRIYKDKNDDRTSPYLLETEGRILKEDECHNYLRFSQPGLKFPQFSVICVVYNDGTSACKGDSGGPLYIEGNKLIGIVSFFSGEGCSIPGYADVYQNVGYFKDWFERQMRDEPNALALIGMMTSFYCFRILKNGARLVTSVFLFALFSL